MSQQLLNNHSLDIDSYIGLEEKILKVKSLKKSSDHLYFSASLADVMFEGITRRSGLPYTSAHLAKVAILTQHLIKNKDHGRIAASAGFLHDTEEDIKFMGVYNPYGPIIEKNPNKIYLNDLLKEFGFDGEQICYIVNKLTHREGVSYVDYFNNIFLSREDDRRTYLPSLKAKIAKTVDLRTNTNPDERENAQKTIDRYRGLSDASLDEIIHFHVKTKTYDFFKKRNAFKVNEENEQLLKKRLEANFKNSQRARSINNLSHFLPLAEQKILEEYEPDNEIFYWNNFRSLLKGLWIDSLIIYASDRPIDERNEAIYEIKKIGRNNNQVKKSGYVTIMEEIRQDLLDDKITIVDSKLKLFLGQE